MQLPLFEVGSHKQSKRKTAPAAAPAQPAEHRWQTPQYILDRAIDVLGAIDLDPCCNSKNAPDTPARMTYTIDDDGLARPWRGRVWLNPPYGRVIGKWLDKLRTEYETGDVTAAIGLLPSRTDTQWWQSMSAYPICFIHGRLHFSGHKNSAPFPSAVVYLGPLLSRFTAAFGQVGTIYTPYGVSDLPPSPTWPR